MKRTMMIGLAAALVAAPAIAQDTERPKAEVVARDDKGRATVVRVGGVEYKVCTPQMQDGCINPREAGLDFGDVPLDHWPGKPASEGGK